LLCLHQIQIFSYGASKQAPQSRVPTIKAPFGSKTATDFDAPDLDVDLYQDDLHAPDIGENITFEDKNITIN
jgi:hypothetical protein